MWSKKQELNMKYVEALDRIDELEKKYSALVNKNAKKTKTTIVKKADNKIVGEIDRKNKVIGKVRYNGNFKVKGKVVYLGVGDKSSKRFLPFTWSNSGKLVYNRLPNLQ